MTNTSLINSKYIFIIFSKFLSQEQCISINNHWICSAVIPGDGILSLESSYSFICLYSTPFSLSWYCSIHRILFPSYQIPTFTVLLGKMYLPLPCCFPFCQSPSYLRPSAQIYTPYPCFLSMWYSPNKIFRKISFNYRHIFFRLSMYKFLFHACYYPSKYLNTFSHLAMYKLRSR